ncbi:uncharacterized protein LOC107420336 isoform X1 [Ziziphus jujuba]|uniref:Uncharacterized protein LOC107420336 isoform X1 n=1 Tax=Ziziphus jujuba TaxID=326968 RepID=A0A6P6FUT0_ZIZJJ|nr:uncharacterized protein LOC107420336 isoform X1 [Ziziphus jujuba]
MEGHEPPCPSPSPYKFSSSLFKDISNYKTPKRASKPPTNFNTPNHPQFFTASKHTPRTSAYSRRRTSLAPSSSARSKASSRLKAYELEQSQSSRLAQAKKEQSLKSLANSLTVWLNFLFGNPGSCGCSLSVNGGNGGGDSVEVPAKGKRDSFPGIGVRVDAAWRCPKRQRDSSWQDVGAESVESRVGFSNSMYLSLRSSLKEVCSLDDLKQRMQVYLSLRSCKEVLDIMTQVAKNIDEGRLKMKTHCPLVTDVGLKEKAVKILMCYNPIWLRIGLYIIFGGDSLLCAGNVETDQEIVFLRMIIEKQFFSHPGLAKSYAYNKMVEGLYRPGYYEALGNVILKRFLLLVLILDRAKSQSSLSLNYGIDGVDGGSPLLFTVQSNTKSSCQVIHDFLSSDIMLGEGNILAHLVIVGYKVSYQQSPLVEYNFQVTDLFVDLQDGVRLCRATQLLLDDSSILMKMVVPSDTRKKYLANCGTVFQYLREAGVILHDEDGLMIVGDDVANGDKELTVSLLWNMFVHLQLPLLIKKTMLVEEICKIRGANMDHLTSFNSSPLEMLLSWIKAICQNYDCKIDNFSSLVDGKAIWCLLDYYFRKELHCSCSSKDSCKSSGEESIMLASDFQDAVHNFVLSQKLTTLLGNFPEVLQISDLLEYNGACNDRSVIILLVFLASQLIVKKNMDQLNFHKLLGCDCQSPDRKYSRVEKCFVSAEAVKEKEGKHGHKTEDAARKFKAIQAWWRDMAERNYKSAGKPVALVLQQLSRKKDDIRDQREDAAKAIQSHFRRVTEHRNFLKMLNAACFLQTAIRAWLTVRQKQACLNFSTVQFQEFYCERGRQSETWHRYFMFIVVRHSFVKLKKSALVIQRAIRNWITQRRKDGNIVTHHESTSHQVNAAIIVQKHLRGWLARSRYGQRVGKTERTLNLVQEKDEHDVSVNEAVAQLVWKNSIVCNSLQTKQFAAAKIQNHFRCWLLRRRFQNQRQAILRIQSDFRMSRCWKAYQQHKISARSATTIQSFVRRWIAQREACRHRHLIVVIQRHCRGWLIRKEFFSRREAAIKIQSAIRGLRWWKVFHCQRRAALEIQRFVRGQITRKKLLGASSLSAVLPGGCTFKSSGGFCKISELELVFGSILKLQRWWRGVLLQKERTKSAVILQTHIRGWIARRKATRERHRITVIQSYWKGYLARKGSRKQLQELRLRVLRSATNVDDGMRIINRLIAALSELLNMKSVSGILHTCATLDMATEHSQKCCEHLVDAGAINTLLKLISSVSRSIPDQEVLKHALSILRNLARYPHLVEAIIDSNRSVETILWEFVRNKEEGYFIASDLLKKICSSQKGIEAVRRSPALLKRLHTLVDELTRKASNERRNARGPIGRENTESRLREAVELLKMAMVGK